MNRQTSRQVGVQAWNPTPNETPRNGDIWYDKATGRFAFREQGVTKYLADGGDGVPTTRRVTAGEGLTGGGTLAADITLAVAFGASAGTACEGNDPRLFNARVPTLHASTHVTGGTDPLSLPYGQITGLPAGAVMGRQTASTGAMEVLSYLAVSGDKTLVHAIDFNQTPAAQAHASGRVYWNDQDRCLNVMTGANAVLQVGQETWIRIVNKTGSPLTDGQVVYINGAQGNRPTVALADADLVTADRTIGVVTETINDDAEGFITVRGLVRGINTGGWTAGDDLYVSSTAGQLTNVAPVAPKHAVKVGTALNSTTNGSIFVSVHAGSDLSSLHDVLISTPLAGQALCYDAAATVWKNQDRFRPMSGVFKSAAGAYEFTMSYDPGTKKVTFTPTGASWRAWVLGNQFNFGTVESTAHSASPGVYYIYVDSAGTITTSSVFPGLRNSAPLAIVKWNGTTGDLQPEWHNAYRNPDEHAQNHLARGTFLNGSGFVLADYALATATDAANTWSLTGGTAYDEDIAHTISAQADGSNYNRAYWDGTTWVYSTANLPFYDAGGGTPWIQYNNFGAGTLVNLGNNDRVNYWVCIIPFATSTRQVWVLPGQVVHSSLAAAQAEAFDYAAFGWLLDQESVAAYKITYVAEAGNANSGKCKIESVQTLSRSRGGITITGGATAVAYTSVLGVPTDTVLGRQSATTGAAEAITCTAAGRALLDDASAAAQKTTLGIGGLATTGITGDLTFTKPGTTARTATFPDAAITVAGSASALTSSYIPYAGAGGILADSVIRQASSKIGVGREPTTYACEVEGRIAATAAAAAVSTLTAATIGLTASGRPQLVLAYAGGGTNEKVWDLTNIGPTLYGRCFDDAVSGASNWLEVTRSGTTISYVRLDGKVGIGRTPTTYALEVASDVWATGNLYAESGKRAAVGGGSTGATTTANGTVTLEINGTTYYLLKAASA